MLCFSFELIQRILATCESGTGWCLGVRGQSGVSVAALSDCSLTS